MSKRELNNRRIVLRRSALLSVGMLFAGSLAFAQKGMIQMPQNKDVQTVTYQNARPVDGYKKFYQMVKDNLKYPELAKDWGTEGTIIVRFKVDQNGKIADVKTTDLIEPSPDILLHKEDLEQAARKAVLATSGDWEPAMMAGKAIASWMTLPVEFKLESFQDLHNMMM